MALTKEMMLDKIRGGWYGKNIGGTLGGPLEGRMELLDVDFYVQEFDGPMPNDDLDLQLVNLHCLEQYGARITTEQIGKEWVSHVFFPFDEYGHALTNMRRDVAFPMAGRFNNLFTDCMGSPIRSEIWAMVAAGKPELAAYYALQDANVDHAGGEGVYGEIFFAALECLAFEESDIDVLIERALAQIPEECVTAKAVRDAMAHYKDGLDWKENRQRIIDVYATPNFTYAPPNIAFTILGLLYGKDFSDAICIACNCGYDTDCTVATLGAILGIMGGMAAIPQKWIDPIGDKIKVSKAVDSFRAPADLEELTERTWRMNRLVDAEWENSSDRAAFALNHRWAEVRRLLPAGSFVEPELSVAMQLGDSHPAIGKDGKRIVVSIRNGLTIDYTGEVRPELPEGLVCAERRAFTLKPGEEKEFSFKIEKTGAVKAFWYPCKLRVERRSNATLWNLYDVPFTLVPTMDWEISSGEKSARLECPTALIEFQKLSTDAGEYRAISVFNIPDERDADFIVASTAPVSLRVDGELVFQSDVYTSFIPAYHRSAREKRGGVRLSAGAHPIEVVVKHKGGDFPEVAFYAVEPGGEGYHSHFIDYTLGE